MARRLRPAPWEPLRGPSIIALDLRNQDFSYQAQIARAERALNRFRNFTNGPNTQDGVETMLDDFLVAAETIRHIKDWIRREEKTGEELSPTLKAFLEGPHQQALADIANGSKHAGAGTGQRSYTQGPLHLGSGTQATDSENTSLADIYARLNLALPPPLPAMRPDDFLATCLIQWKEYAWENLGLPRLQERWIPGKT